LAGASVEWLVGLLGGLLVSYLVSDSAQFLVGWVDNSEVGGVICLLFGWSVDQWLRWWLGGWLAGLSVDRSAGRSVDKLIGWSVGWSVVLSAGWSITGSVSWIFGYLFIYFVS